ncbi:MAG: 5'/3'-nucleotidase SurE [Holosporaceae bacterium]|jgi:5'-nucleotidase|nr:5'/3'-nucleotidase SurE [Holosporaceae bacterium]
MTTKQSLSGLRVLVTNDDGIDSSGIKALERIANSITPDVWVVAPKAQQSGKGHSITFDNILRVHELSPRKFSVSGTPTDCVFVALGEILKDKKPDLLLSGINNGSNIADFIGMSGTVGAAFAAASMNIKSMAISQDTQEDQNLSKFPLIDHFLPIIIKKLISFSWPKQTCMNINFPNVKVGEVNGIRIASQGDMCVTWNVHKKDDPVGCPYYWLHSTYSYDENANKNSDVVLLEKRKSITITALRNKHEFLECTDKLEELFASNA